MLQKLIFAYNSIIVIMICLPFTTAPPSGYSPGLAGDSSTFYKLHTTTKNFDDARSQCDSEDGAKMISLESQAKYNSLMNICESKDKSITSWVYQCTKTRVQY